jgi:DNA adenine methylase
MNSPLKWHGGKHFLAKRIVELMPAHTSYLDAYAGGLSVLLSKPSEGISEYANDLNGELTNFWGVLSNEVCFEQFSRCMAATPLSEYLFDGSLYPAEPVTSNIERAYWFFIRSRQSRQGLGRDYCTPTSRRRRGMNENVSAWLSAVDGLPEIHARLRRVEVWNRPAVEAIAKLDGPDFLVYCDPPYLHETRSTTGEYGDFEMNTADHKKLLLTLAGMKGKFLLSGYPSQLYTDTASLCGWKCHTFDLPNNASSSATKERKTECLWRNYD